MRGPDEQTSHMVGYLSPEQRVRQDHPLRPIRRMTDEVRGSLSARFTKMYSDMGRPSIPPEQLLRGLVLQMLYTIRSERLLMEEIDYSVLSRCAFFDAVIAPARTAGLLPHEHFTVDGTLVEAGASPKSFRRKDEGPTPPPTHLPSTIAWQGRPPVVVTTPSTVVMRGDQVVSQSPPGALPRSRTSRGRIALTA